MLTSYTIWRMIFYQRDISCSLGLGPSLSLFFETFYVVQHSVLATSVAEWWRICDTNVKWLATSTEFESYDHVVLRGWLKLPLIDKQLVYCVTVSPSIYQNLSLYSVTDAFVQQIDSECGVLPFHCATLLFHKVCFYSFLMEYDLTT
jgi:hypothetical protein